MKKLKNWDNKTWLSSKSYIFHFNKFLKTKINLNKNSKILDIGCGRANIISALQKKYKFKNKPIGIDVVANKGIKKNIEFEKIDALKYLKYQEKFDLILIKQTIHFFSKIKIRKLLELAKKRLNKHGKIIILTLDPNKNEIPCFILMKKYLLKSLKKDKMLLKEIKKVLKNYSKSNFILKISIKKSKYVQMLKNNYISCLLNIPKHKLLLGIKEIKEGYGQTIIFNDKLICLTYKN